MKQILFFLLVLLARAIIRIKKPYVIGVTATAGKTTMTHFIATFLKNVYDEKEVGYSKYNYNGEYGLPLSVIGVKNPDKNPLLWLYVFFIALTRLVRPYPRFLILEYGIDHPGEMDFLLSIALPTIAIVGPISPNHMEQFGTMDRYRNEKLKLTYHADHIIAYAELKKHLTSDATFYSLWAMSDIDASHIGEKIDGIEATIHYRKQDFPVTVPLFWAYQLLNILPLFEIAAILNIKQSLLIDTLSLLSVWAGRSTLLRGIENTTIIDGSYNGGYLSITEWILTLKALCGKVYTILFLWDMRELWEMTASMHQELAHCINTTFPLGSNLEVVLVWENMKRYLLPELDARFSPLHFLSSRDAGRAIQNKLHSSPEEKKIVFVKGSQNTIFLEEGIKQFLLESSDEKLLCRQSSKWMRVKERFFESLNP